VTIRFASFNVENLFSRPKALARTVAEGESILAAFREFNTLIKRSTYTAANRARMVDLLLQLGVYRREGTVIRRSLERDHYWAWLRGSRGTFDVEHPDCGIEIVASGRADWMGWLDLAVESVDELATRMTARVISAVGADILGVLEADDRPSLARVNEDLLDGQYGHVRLMDGNDSRRIDIGIMTTPRIEVSTMRSAVDVPDPTDTAPLFSRDCAQYLCHLSSGARVWVLLNHFKSQSGGGLKRKRQAECVRKIVDDLHDAGERNIVVMGDFNEGPPQVGEIATNLTSLLDANGPLVDVYRIPGFTAGPQPGTFQDCSIRNRFDYILLSRNLASRVEKGGIERRGLWGDPANVNAPTTWPIFAEITAAKHAASDHAAIYVDVDIQ